MHIWRPISSTRRKAPAVLAASPAGGHHPHRLDDRGRRLRARPGRGIRRQRHRRRQRRPRRPGPSTPTCFTSPPTTSSTGAWAVRRRSSAQSGAASTPAPSSWARRRCALLAGRLDHRPDRGGLRLSAGRGGPTSGAGWWTPCGRRKPVRLFEDQWVSPSLALNVAEMLGELAERRLTGVWNVAGAEVVNRMQFGTAALRGVRLRPGAASSGTPRRCPAWPVPRPPRSGLKVQKALATAQGSATRPAGIAGAVSRRGRGIAHERHRPRRRLGNAAVPTDPGGQQAAPAGLRQADDLLPAQRR